MQTYRELLAARDRLERDIERAREEEIGLVIASIWQQMDEYGLTVEDLQRYRSKPLHRRRAVPKYRDPRSGATWSGRGRPPSWFDPRAERDFLILK
ncbi:hypothetical protein CY652_13595 [Burkholderia sp. WAC0059]|nr:H-NS histone family protein [Burkholderia sp. WAC0059]PLZ01863.1 hypothetical protein CY652_13595 [Burkholderia sp. WAC0059]